MIKLCWISLVLFGAVLAFFAGYTQGHHPAAARPAAGGRKILYYVDPMNPTHTSDRPGLAPCGMKMEPVYADTDPGTGLTSVPAMLPPGTVKVSAEWQLRLDIRVAKPQKKPLQDSLRLFGKVAVDEARLYRVNAPVSGWITRALPYSTGSPVKKDEVLAGFYAPEFLPAVQSIFFYLSSQDRAQPTATEPQPRTNHLSMVALDLSQNTDVLQSMGMSPRQIEQLVKSRSFDKNVDIASPADGFILQRNLSEGLRFEKGAEWFRIADLRQVWILVDLPETDAASLPSGTAVRVLVRGGPRTATLPATVSPALPQFDPVSRTLKVRLDAPNPDFRLKPDMLVDVDIARTLAEGLVVPADAVLDSGLRQTVFVERSPGLFEPRTVVTGERCGDQVQILNGLRPEESIAVSGTFLIDSESRLKLAVAQAQNAQEGKRPTGENAGAETRDPVCHMAVKPEEARTALRFAEYQGQTYYFCSPGCQTTFQADPAKVLMTAQSRSGGTDLQPAMPQAEQSLSRSH
jgi:membrane fusion protein, copper/silver efflux system